MSKENFIKDNVIGSIARDWLSVTKEATVLGTTSSGIFMHLNDGFRTIYLSNYPDFGPINLNLKEELPQNWQNGKSLSIRFKDNTLHINSGAIALHMNNFALWKNQPTAEFDMDKTIFFERAKKTANQLMMIKGDHGFTALLPNMYNHTTDSIPENLTNVYQNMIKIKKAFQKQDEAAAISSVRPLISYGRGLTPSGDDYLTGLIFCLRRKDHAGQYTHFLDSLQDEFLRTAASLTTSISTSLIFASFSGQAHSRTENMTEALTVKSIPFSNQALRMAGWGSSSGADTTLGIFTAVQLLLGI